MLYMLSWDANSKTISYWQVGKIGYTNILSFSERKLTEYHTLDVNNSMALSVQLRCCVLKKVFPVNQWRGILNYTYKNRLSCSKIFNGSENVDINILLSLTKESRRHEETLMVDQCTLDINTNYRSG